jgi:hypothetical protein
MKRMLRTPTADVALHETWCVVVTIHPDPLQSMEDARANLAASIEMCGGVRRPLLVDITHARPLDPEVRHLYTGELLVASFTGLALLVEATPLGYVMGNIYLRIARPGIPTRLFAERSEALAWLKGFL